MKKIETDRKSKVLLEKAFTSDLLLILALKTIISILSYFTLFCIINLILSHWGEKNRMSGKSKVL